MSHELRTPLNAITGYAEMLQEELREAGSPADWARDLSRILDSARHLLQVISDILDLSKIEAGHLQLDVQDLCPAVLLAQVVDAITPAATTNGSTVACSVTSTRRVRADPLRLLQILLNLASNAAKFTHNGTIELRAVSEGEQVVFVVRDSGVGIANADLRDLFTPFMQVGRRKSSIGGTGLGLSIARELSRRMGGDILVDSTEGVGSIFRVCLPATPAAAAQ